MARGHAVRFRRNQGDDQLKEEIWSLLWQYEADLEGHPSKEHARLLKDATAKLRTLMLRPQLSISWLEHLYPMLSPQVEKLLDNAISAIFDNEAVLNLELLSNTAWGATAIGSKALYELAIELEFLLKKTPAGQKSRPFVAIHDSIELANAYDRTGPIAVLALDYWRSTHLQGQKAPGFSPRVLDIAWAAIQPDDAEILRRNCYLGMRPNLRRRR